MPRCSTVGAVVQTNRAAAPRGAGHWEAAVIVDRAAENGADGVIIRDGALVGHLQRAWERTWASARPFSSSPGGHGYGSAKDELRRSILQLLESGMKDDLAARRLSMSTSTYRRHVTDR